MNESYAAAIGLLRQAASVLADSKAVTVPAYATRLVGTTHHRPHPTADATQYTVDRQARLGPHVVFAAARW